MERRAVQAIFMLGGVVAVCGGIALAIITIVDPVSAMLPRFERAWLIAVGGFAAAALCVIAIRLAPLRASRSSAPPAPVPPVPAAKPGGAPDAATALQQMRTYIGIEVWDLALEKANEILSRYPGTPEAETVERTINDIRWKAEPKPPPPSPATAAKHDEEMQAMLRHVKTYMDLEMWDLARQKALDIAKKDSESEAAVEAGRLLVEIEKKRATTG